MTKRYMIGTLSDTPLLKVSVNSVDYLVDVKAKKVFADEKGIPQVHDEEIVESVLEAIK